MHGRENSTGSNHWKSTAGCVIIFLLCIAAAHPVLNGPYSDDFSYAFSAQRAAETGRIIYNGWACPMLGIQIYVAALFIKLFGFSFTVVRATVVLFAAANVAVLHRLFLRISPRNSNAVIAALSMATAPIAFSQSAIFFTDLPGQFAFTVALFCCVRALQAETPKDTIRWLFYCVVLNLLLGTVRQTAWFGSLVLLPAVGWRLRDRPGVLRCTAFLWVFSACFVYACVRWLSHAPYAPHESLLQHLPLGWLPSIPLLPSHALLELLPLLMSVAFIREAIRDRRMVLISLSAAVLSGALAFTVGRSYTLTLLSSVLGWAPAYSLTLSAFLVAIISFPLALAVQEICTHGMDSTQTASRLDTRTLLAVLWPYLLVVSSLVMTRESQWPRYILPLTPALALLIYALYTERTHGAKLPVLTTVIAAIAATVAVGRLHDEMTHEGLVLNVQQHYLSLNIPRNQVETGMAEDGWYELTTGHHINEPRIREPKDAYHPRPLTLVQRNCHTYLTAMAPDIHSVYVVANTPSPCMEPQPLLSETQTYWMRPQETLSLFRYIPSQRLQ